MKKRLVIVHWKDIECTSGWQDEPTKALPVLKSAGFYVNKTNGVYRIGSTYDKINKKWADVNEYPVGCVDRIEEVAKVEI